MIPPKYKNSFIFSYLPRYIWGSSATPISNRYICPICSLYRAAILCYTRIQQQSIKQVPRHSSGRIGKWVENPCGTAAVKAEPRSNDCHCGYTREGLTVGYDAWAGRPACLTDNQTWFPYMERLNHIWHSYAAYAKYVQLCFGPFCFLQTGGFYWYMPHK